MGSWEWNILDDRAWWSDELYHLFGKERRDFVPSLNAWFDLVHPDDRARVRDQLDHVLEREERYAAHYRVVRDDGEVVPVLTAMRLERTVDGRPAKLTGTAQILPDPELPE
jgi:PAS domain S-box-containing protein